MTVIATLSISLTTALAAPAAPAFITAPAALADTSWLGEWMLDISESDFGVSPAPDSAATIITRADDRLVMTRKVWTSMAGNRTVEFDQATDGEEAAGSSSRDEEIPSRAWWEGSTLVVEVEVESNMGPIVVTDRMILTGDDTLLLERSMDVPGMGELEQTIVYRRRVGLGD